ncbi:MAG TPA: hypothetical protein VN947_17520 [Polyangia bacterium]|nr:hypothetical protein [Polyangia bacterium]
MMPGRSALLVFACATTLLFSVGHPAAGEPEATSKGSVSPALIGLAPGTQTAQPPPRHRTLWIALGVVSAAAVVGAIIAVGVSLGTSSSNHSVFNDWGTVTVTRR